MGNLRAIWRFVFGSLVAGLWIASAAVARGQDRADAQAIFDATGVQGGLVVHVGCGDGCLTAALCAADNYLVVGLGSDPAAVELARRHVGACGLSGPVTVANFDGRHLPLIDNLVNLIVAETPCEVKLAEMLRVLAPGGVAYVRGDDGWQKTVKPRPEEIDEWTHFLHGADNNAVARDRAVSLPFHMQWVGDPKWARHHNHLSSLSAMVSSAGRLFAIVDEGPIASMVQPAQWRLVAWDAFNGTVLWKKEVSPWEGQLRPFRSGPPELSRRLVAVGDRVYVTLGYGAPLVSLDAATGELVRSYEDTEGTVEIVCHDGVLYVVAGTMDAGQYAAAQRRGGASPPPRGKRICAIDARTGRRRWAKSDDETAELLPTTLCVAGERVYFHSTEFVHCLEASSGEEVWRSPRPVKTRRLGWSTPTLVVHEDVVLCADCAGPSGGERAAIQPAQVEWRVTAGPKRGDASLGQLIAFSASDGRRLWQCPTAQGYNAPPDVFVVDNLVWTSTVPNLTSADFAQGRDLHTGEVKRHLVTDAAFTTTHHHRCYRNKATERFILLGRTGTELIDLTGETPLRNCWIRGACQYGVLPCNGLLYLPPHACACYIQSKLSGLWALAPRSASRAENRAPRSEERLQRGPAYDDPPPDPLPTPSAEDWPTYRHDALRSGRAPNCVASDLNLLWESRIAARATSPTISDGRVFLALPDVHAVRALDAASGQTLWTRTVEGRVDSPPTIDRGRVLFGSADGHVYCLRAVDGELIWRFRAAPQDLRTVACGQVESVWPVTGSVLVHDGWLACTAGRSSYLDGGMHWYQLDSRSGQVQRHRCFYSRDPQTGAQPEASIEDVELPGSLPDVLSCDGENIFWRDKRLDLRGRELEPNVPHMYSSAGLLDDNWWHRTYWIFGTKTYGRASGWAVAGNYVPSGRIMTLDEKTVFGYGLRKIGGGRGLGGAAFHLFRADQAVTRLPARRPVKNNNLALAEHFVPTKVSYHWSENVPLVVRAMVLTPDQLLVAGPASEAGAAGYEPTLTRDADSVLMVYSADEGRPLARVELRCQPVFDGMAAAHGKVYVTSLDQTVRCYGSDAKGKP